MLSILSLLTLNLAVAGQLETGAGVIRGTVVNASQDGAAQADAEVVLRVRLNGQFVPVARTQSDAQGSFQFTGLPVGEDQLYLPGANHDGIHYPGPRLPLTAMRSRANVKLKVHDTLTHPNPLVVRRHQIWIQTEPGALRVTESLVVDNPTQTTYVGQPTGEETEPVTLALAIPMDFDRTTFNQEFYGRRFSIADGKLVTSIPWTPGRRDLRFTYTIPNAERYRVWQRPLDLPCDFVQLRVEHDPPEEVVCTLPPAPEAQGVGADLSVGRFDAASRARGPRSVGSAAATLDDVCTLVGVGSLGLFGRRGLRGDDSTIPSTCGN